ncbi:MAG: FkbM family methyltransferase [Candidatus Vogelbacteria bacterium]|nr:FkbM family methyltransferase [Candidatus Vogelbacteria bacterium]
MKLDRFIKFISNRLKIWQLELTFISKLRLFFWSFLCPFFKKIKIPIPTIHIKFKNKSLFIFDWTDMGTFFEIFIFEEYFVEVDQALVKRVLDLGSNRGYSSIYLANKFPGAQVISVEADPGNIEKLKINLSDFGDNGIVIEPKAISDHGGVVDFYLNFGVSISGSTLIRDAKAKKVSVPAMTLVDLEKKYGSFDVVKFDIEGTETTAIKPESLGYKPMIWIGEYHEDLTAVPLDVFLQRFEGYRLSSVRKIAKFRSLIILELIK